MAAIQGLQSGSGRTEQGLFGGIDHDHAFVAVDEHPVAAGDPGGEVAHAHHGGIFSERATMTAWLVLLPESVTMPIAALRSMLAASEGEMSFATTMRFSASSLRLCAA